jgi:uncharacterized membrane protein YciS (DUF1049 family)
MTQIHPERDRLIARKNQQLGTLLALVIGGGLAIAYLTRFVLWHMVFAK